MVGNDHRRGRIAGALLVGMALTASACSSSTDLASACGGVDVEAMSAAANAVVESENNSDLPSTLDAVANLLEVSATQLGPVAEAAAANTGNESLNQFEPEARRAASDLQRLAGDVRNGQSLDDATTAMAEMFAGLEETLGAGVFSGESGDLLATVPECAALDTELSELLG